MKLCCATKGCAHQIDRPEHKRGFLLVRCESCGRTTDHFPQNLVVKRDGPRILYRNPKYSAHR
jgi:hypothetical protein